VSFDKSVSNYLKSSDHAVGSDLDFFIKYFKNKKFEKALDVACAAGHFAKTFSADKIYTTDLSFNMLKTARDSMGFDMPVLSRGEFLPYLDEVFDLVGCRIAMHHFMSPCMFIYEAFRVLKNSGYFVLIDSVVDFEDAELNRLELIRDSTHRRSLRMEEIIALAEAEGFLLETAQVFLKRHDFDEWARRLNPSEEHYQSIVQAFLELSAKMKKELRLETEGDKVISYTDKKALFVFKKV